MRKRCVNVHLFDAEPEEQLLGLHADDLLRLAGLDLRSPRRRGTRST